MHTMSRMTTRRAPFIAATLFAANIGFAATVGAVTFAGLSEVFSGHPAFAQSQAEDQEPDPADANMAPVDGSQQSGLSVYAQPVSNQQNISQAPRAGVVNESQQQAAQYSQQGAPIERRDPSQNDSQPYSSQPYDSQGQNSNGTYDTKNDDYQQQVDAGQEALESEDPPPPLPVYEQPEAPAPDYLWTPGYWGWMPIGYYWVPGAWCAAPYQGALWTPGYWGYYGNRYRYHRGFWGLHIGFYGGVNYGFGYFGTGYYGGYWNGPHFFYNRSVNRINVTRITNVYNRTYINRVNVNNRISYNGGRGGIEARPRPAELIAMRGPRNPPMSTQIQMQRQASENREQFYNQNRGRPAIVAASRPVMADRGVRPMPVMQARPIQQGNRPAVQQPGLVQGQPGNRIYQQNGNQNQVRPYPQNGQQNGLQNGTGQRPSQRDRNQNGYPNQGGRFPQNGPVPEPNSPVTRPSTDLGAPQVRPIPEQHARPQQDRPQSQDGFRRQQQQPQIQQPQIQPQPQMQPQIQQQPRLQQDMREQQQRVQEMRQQQQQQRQQPDMQRQQEMRQQQQQQRQQPDMQRQQEMRQQQQQPRPEMQRPQEMRQQPQMRQQENHPAPQATPAPIGPPRR